MQIILLDHFSYHYVSSRPYLSIREMKGSRTVSVPVLKCWNNYRKKSWRNNRTQHIDLYLLKRYLRRAVGSKNTSWHRKKKRQQCVKTSRSRRGDNSAAVHCAGPLAASNIFFLPSIPDMASTFFLQSLSSTGRFCSKNEKKMHFCVCVCVMHKALSQLSDQC